MTGPDLCQHPGCTRMVSRGGFCRPRYITRHLGWTITDVELRKVPLGRFTDAQLAVLRRETFGACRLAPILRTIEKLTNDRPEQGTLRPVGEGNPRRHEHGEEAAPPRFPEGMGGDQPSDIRQEAAGA